MIGSDFSALDKNHRLILDSMRWFARKRELYAQRPGRDYSVQDEHAAQEMQRLKGYWQLERDKADQEFCRLALEKPPRERIGLYRSRAQTAAALAQFDSKHAAAARQRNCPVADDYQSISEALQRKAQEFACLLEQAKRDADAGRMAEARASDNEHDRNRSVRYLAQQFSRRAEQAANPEDRARLLAQAEAMRAELPEKPLLGATDQQL